MRRSHIALLAFGVVLLVAYAATPQMTGQVQVTGQVQLNGNAQKVQVTGQLQIANPVQAKSRVECNGKYKGLKPTPVELQDILKKHDEWLQAVQAGGLDDLKDPRIVNLCGADLAGVHLEGAHLDYGHLENAYLDYAYLDDASLYGAHLERASLIGGHLIHTHLDSAYLQGANFGIAHLEYASLISAHLESADLSYAHLEHTFIDTADLRGTSLQGADLQDADLDAADMQDASLYEARLESATLVDTHLDGADLGRADLNGAYMDFDPDSLPKAVSGISTAKNLHLIRFLVQPGGLVKLRSEFKDLGMRAQEAQLTCAIRRSELSRKDFTSDVPGQVYVHSWSERAINTVLFDWTCQYGMSPGRPLLIVATLAVILSIVYIFAQVNPGPNGGIWAIWDEHRVKQAEGSKEPQQLTDGFPSGHWVISVFLLALYFSLLSATRIGWHELNVGTWITRIQPREYSLRATGWVRVVSGVQSLISVYLVALTILTYFGTPFEY
jgi:uncharacterized protein YjbI with pentapeptide repeats